MLWGCPLNELKDFCPREDESWCPGTNSVLLPSWQLYLCLWATPGRVCFPHLTNKLYHLVCVHTHIHTHKLKGHFQALFSDLIAGRSIWRLKNMQFLLLDIHSNRYRVCQALGLFKSFKHPCPFNSCKNLRVWGSSRVNIWSADLVNL